VKKRPLRGPTRVDRFLGRAGRRLALSRRALALVEEWATLHQDELVANWERARREEPLQPIEPLP